MAVIGTRASSRLKVHNEEFHLFRDVGWEKTSTVDRETVGVGQGESSLQELPKKNNALPKTCAATRLSNLYRADSTDDISDSPVFYIQEIKYIKLIPR